MIDQVILAQAENVLRQCLKEWPDARDQAYIYESFSLRFEGSQYATQAMLRLLASLLHGRISGHVFDASPLDAAADPSLNSASDLPSDTQRRHEAEPPSLTTPPMPSHTASVGEPPAPAPIAIVPPEPVLARERPARQHVVTRQVPHQAVNPPRVSLASITAANQRLARSLLDTWTVAGRKFGDCKVQEVLDACDSRDRTTALMRAVVRDLPRDHVIRTVLTAEGAQARYMDAMADLHGTTIDATQPGGYRHVG